MARRLELAAFAALYLAVSLPLALPAAAETAAVGTVAGVEGEAQIGRGDLWQEARIGSTVQVGDVLRTGDPGRMRVVFQDDSVLNISDGSEIVVDEQIFDPGGTSQSLLQLIKGKVRALVSEYYERHGSVYEIETVTAVSGVRGTEFVVLYDPDTEVTEVVGIRGRVEVFSVLDRTARGVLIGAGEMTSVRKGEYPSPPPRLDDERFRQYLDGLEFIGAGRPESLTSDHPVVGGASVPEPDRAPSDSLVDGPGPQKREENASDLLQQPPAVIESGELGVRF